MPFAVAFGLAVGLIPVARRAGVALGLVDRPSDPVLAIHSTPVPVLGGPAVIAAALGSAAILGDRVPAAVVWAVVIALVIGTIDDARPRSAAERMVFLIAAGVVLAAGGIEISALGALSGVGVVLLTVACANATNLLDGQNGLAGGLAVFAALGLASVTTANGSRGLSLALAGALAAFLLWNLPGRIFLGNGGAYAVGTLLAAVAADAASVHGWRSTVAVAACLGVFAFELIFTVIRRLLSGGSLAAGDRHHSYDLVSGQLGSRGRATAAFWVTGALAAGVGLVANRFPVGGAVALSGALGVAATAWGIRLWSRRDDAAPKSRSSA